MDPKTIPPKFVQKDKLFEEEKTDPAIHTVPTEFLEEEPTDPGIKITTDDNDLAQTAGQVVDLGVIDDYLSDPHVTEIMINDTRNIMLEKSGRITHANARIETETELTRITREILKLTDRPFNYENPALDLALPDGSRLQMITAPLVRTGTCITIRKFPKRYSMGQLQTLGTFDETMGIFLQKCVQGRINILVSGGTGSGKTTLLSALASCIPKEERIITIEDTAELRLSHPNLVQLYTRPKQNDAPAVNQRELIAHSLRMRPDRIILGECRRGEALDMLQAMNSGHDGSLTTVHANSPRDAIARVETLCMMAGFDQLSLIAIRRQLVAAIELLVHVERIGSGGRKIMRIAEITGMENDVVTLQDLFHYETYENNAREADSRFVCDGFVPTFVKKLKDKGIEFPPRFFG